MIIDNFDNGYDFDTVVIPINEDPYDVEFGNLYVPKDWKFWFIHGPDETIPWDEDNVDGWCQPEARGVDPVYKERIYSGDSAYTWFGFGKIFDAGIFRRLSAEINKTVSASVKVHAWSSIDDDASTSEGAGDTNYFSETSPELSDAIKNITFYIGIDPYGEKDPLSDNIIWSEGYHSYNAYNEISIETIAKAEKVTVFIRAVAMWRHKHNDVYLDNFIFEVKDDSQLPVQDKEGLPRVQYERTYVLLPQNVSLATSQYITQTYFDNKYTIGYSADDAGIGALDLKNAIVVWESEDSWVKDDIENFFNKYYPGTQVYHNKLYYEEDSLILDYPTTHLPPVITSRFGEDRGTYIHNGLDLRSSWNAWKDELVACIDGLIIDSSEDSSKGYGNTVVISTTFNGKPILIRYAHLLDSGTYVEPGDYVRRGDKLGKPGNTGCSTGDHLHIDVRINGEYVDPETLIDFPEDSGTEPLPGKKVNPVSFHIQTTDKVEDALENYIKKYKPTVIKFFSPGVASWVKQHYPEIITVYRHYIDYNTQLRLLRENNPKEYIDMFYDSIKPYEDIIDYVESINEMCACNDVISCVNFDTGFIQELAKSGLKVKPLILTIPVGNPAESQYEDLVPAIEELVKYDGAVGYHAYWWVDNYECGLESWWKWHAGRWTEMDKVFNKHGLYPKYILGEIGAVGTTDKGYTLLPKSGWQDYMEIDSYINQLELFGSKISEWNSSHQNRCLGGTIFTLCTWDWDSFHMQAGDIDKLTERLCHN